jgi:hypothetical protein
MSGDRHVAVANHWSSRVSVFSIDGQFIRNVGVSVLTRPEGVACSAFDELIVADTGNHRVVVFSDVGDLLMTFGGRVCVSRTPFVKELLAMAKRARVLRDDALSCPAWPLCSSTARLLWLRAVCAVAEGADVPLSHAMPDASSRCPPDVCVAAVLGDALR